MRAYSIVRLIVNLYAEYEIILVAAGSLDLIPRYIWLRLSYIMYM